MSNEKKLRTRVWDKKRKQWVECNYAVLPDGELMFQTDVCSNWFAPRDPDRFILVRDTGFNTQDGDGNDVPIWDGDIFALAGIDCVIGTDVVQWDDLHGCWGLGEDSILSEMNFARDKRIGNIYENPELISDGAETITITTPSESPKSHPDHLQLAPKWNKGK